MVNLDLELRLRALNEMQKRIRDIEEKKPGLLYSMITAIWLECPICAPQTCQWYNKCGRPSLSAPCNLKFKEDGFWNLSKMKEHIKQSIAEIDGGH